MDLSEDQAVRNRWGRSDRLCSPRTVRDRIRDRAHDWARCTVHIVWFITYNFNNSLRLHPLLAISRANILFYVWHLAGNPCPSGFLFSNESFSEKAFHEKKEQVTIKTLKGRNRLHLKTLRRGNRCYWKFYLSNNDVVAKIFLAGCPILCQSLWKDSWAWGKVAHHSAIF